MSDRTPGVSRQQRRALDRLRKKGALRSLGTKAGLLTLGAAAAAGSADAANFSVTNNADSGTNSLRWAVDQANLNAGPDTIDFVGVVSPITLTTGEIAITDDVEIQGPGSGALTVTENTGGRIFYIYNGSASISVTIAGLTLSDAGNSSIRGGAIYLREEALTINDSVLSGNVAGEGGAVFVYASGTLETNNTTFTGNYAAYDGGAVADGADGGGPSVLRFNDTTFSLNEAAYDGGAIDANGQTTINGSTFTDNDAYYFGGAIHQDGTLTIDDTTFTGNYTAGYGGAIAIHYGTALITNSEFTNNDAPYGGAIQAYDAVLTIDGSTFTGNEAGYGGALYLDQVNLTLTDSQFTNNTADVYGGAIHVRQAFNGDDILIERSVFTGNSADDGGAISLGYIGSDVIIRDTTIEGNTASVHGGGVTIADTYAYGYVYPAGSVGSSGSVTFERTTIANNQAPSGAGVQIHETYGGPVNFVNVTISGNTATSGIGGGVALDSYATDVYFDHTTIANNTATTSGGGIFAGTNARADIQNSIIGDNSAGVSGSDLSGTSFNGSFNLIEDGSGFTITGSSNITGADPQLGPLQLNGGTTETHAITSSSPAFNTGDPTFVPPPATDQRGANRVFGPRLDMGAFEAQAAAVPGVVQFSVASVNVNENDGTVTITVVRTGGSDGTVTVNFATSGGSATSGVDFTPNAGILTFVAGDVSETFTVAITDDALPEASESFTATLSNPTGGATIGSPSTITVTILDNDEIQPIPTVEDTAKIALGVLIAIAALTALGKGRFTAAMVLLALGAIGAAAPTAQAETPAKRARKGAAAGAEKGGHHAAKRELATITRVERSGASTVLHLANGTRVTVANERIEIESGEPRADRKARRSAPARERAKRRDDQRSEPVSVSAIPVNQQVLLKVKNRHGRTHVKVTSGRALQRMQKNAIRAAKATVRADRQDGETRRERRVARKAARAASPPAQQR